MHGLEHGRREQGAGKPDGQADAGQQQSLPDDQRAHVR
jgi:hypothetical protein